MNYLKGVTRSTTFYQSCPLICFRGQPEIGRLKPKENLTLASLAHQTPYPVHRGALKVFVPPCGTFWSPPRKKFPLLYPKIHYPTYSLTQMQNERKSQSCSNSNLSAFSRLSSKSCSAFMKHIFFSKVFNKKPINFR